MFGIKELIGDPRLFDVVSKTPLPNVNPETPNSTPHSVSLRAGNQETDAPEAVIESIEIVLTKGLGQVGASLINKLSTKISL